MKESMTFIRQNRIGSLTISTIGNPAKVLCEKDRSMTLNEIAGVMEETTGKPRPLGKIERYAFGIPDRGRILSLFQDDNKVIGFTSFHLLNNGKRIFRLAGGSTVLHAGSGHILPEHQGNGLIKQAAIEFISSLESDLKPDYFNGFTQSPRFLKLIKIMTKGKVHPLPNESGGYLALAQAEILTEIFAGKIAIREGCVVERLDEPVYRKRVYSGDEEIDKMFYETLGVCPEEGEFLHFVAVIPEGYYENSRD